MNMCVLNGLFFRFLIAVVIRSAATPCFVLVWKKTTNMCSTYLYGLVLCVRRVCWKSSTMLSMLCMSSLCSLHKFHLVRNDGYSGAFQYWPVVRTKNITILFCPSCHRTFSYWSISIVDHIGFSCPNRSWNVTEKALYDDTFTGARTHISESATSRHSFIVCVTAFC